MILESRYWKDSLLELADGLRKLPDVDEMSEDDFGGLEKDLLIGFYSIRKLVEAQTKVTDEVTNTMISVTTYPNRAPVNHLTKDSLDSVYDMNTPSESTENSWNLASVFIHSYVLMAVADEEGPLYGVYVTSKRFKDSKLYFVSVCEILRLFERFGNDYPTAIEWKRLDGGKDDFRVY